MLEKLNPLMLEAAERLADGETPQQVKDVLALSLPEFMQWRTEPLFVSEVARLKAERKLEASKTAETKAETAEGDAFETELTRQFGQ